MLIKFPQTVLVFPAALPTLIFICLCVYGGAEFGFGLLLEKGKHPNHRVSFFGSKSSLICVEMKSLFKGEG